MKHLRRFNESLTQDELQELKEFTESCLAYLLDEGFELDYISFDESTKCYWIDLYGSRDEEDLSRNFSWKEVKDYYIPFVSLLRNRYTIKDQVYFKVQTGRRFDEHTYINYTIDEIINDKITIPKNDYSYTDNIFSISVKISEKL